MVRKPPNKPGLPTSLMVTGISAWVAWHAQPFVVGGVPQALPVLAGGIAALGAMRLLITATESTARLVEWWGSQTTTGKPGTATWATRKEILKELGKDFTGMFWGMSVGRKSLPLFIPYGSNAFTVCPNSGGKGIYSVVMAGLAITDPKLFIDYKGELACILKPALEARGERVLVLNSPRLWEDQLGSSEQLSPLDVFVDSLYRAGGLRDIPADCRELTKKILAEPAEQETDNSYFRQGGRDCVVVAIVLEVLLEGYDATLESVALMIEDRERLLHHLCWVIGLDLEGNPLPDGPMPIEASEWTENHSEQDIAKFAKWFRGKASNLHSMMTKPDARTFDSFISTSQQAVASFSFGVLSQSLGRSTFSPNDLKEGEPPTTVFIVVDASRPETYKPYIEIMQWTFFTAIKRHPDKAKAVYAILDECTNYSFDIQLLTWARAYGLRLHLIFQDFTAFMLRNGEKAVEILWSECEIKQILPGQRSQPTLERISKALGDQGVAAAHYSDKGHGVGETFSESARPLMTPDELRRTDYGVLFVRKQKPILFEPISYAEIDPWRKQVGINPFHGKPFLKKARLKLRKWRRQ